MPDPLSQFRDRDAYADARQSTPYTSHGGEKTNPFDGVPLGRAKSSRESYHREEPSNSDDGTAGSHKNRSSSVPESGLHTPQDDAHPTYTAGETSDTSFRARANASNLYESHDPASGAANQAGPPDQGASGPSFFNFPVGDGTTEQTSPSTGQNPFAKSSVDDINTQFVNDEGANAWQFSAGSGEPQEGHPSSRPSSGGRGTRRSPLKRPSMRRPEPPAPEAQAETQPTGFNADAWNDQFGPQAFVPQPTPGNSASPTRRANSKKVKARPTAGSAAVVDEDSSEGETYEWRGRGAGTKQAPVDSPQAMDIDSPPTVPTAASSDSNSARNIPVEPTRPEWRPGNVDAVAGDGKPQRPEKIPLDPNTMGSEDSEDIRASFADLKNVAPFAHEQSGLRSLDDLKDSLPFESKASEELPIKKPKAPPLDFPSPPEAPRLPPTVAIEGMKPNAASWSKYLEDFEIYLRQWDSFNGQVVDHFATRKSNISSIRAAKGYSFLGARSDSDIQSYMQWVQQDNYVRQRWSAACEEHEKRLREFMAFREKMK